MRVFHTQPLRPIKSDSASYKVLVIIWIDNREGMLRIIVGESFGQFWLFGLTPFELVGMQNTVDVFYIIDFLLLLGSPKVIFPIEKAIGIVLQALTHKKVFPQRPREIFRLFFNSFLKLRLNERR